MSKKRQSAIFDPAGNRKADITTLARDFPAGHVVPLHFHDWDQLVYASLGVMTVRTKNGTWVAPPHRAIWIPASVPHSITMSGLVAMRTLYFRKRLVSTLPRECCVINISPLLRELILYSCGFRVLKKRLRRQQHLIGTIMDQLEAVQMIPLQLPHVSDPRALQVAKALMSDPSSRRTLAQICKTSGASKRTVERLFQQSAGMTFGKWRQQLRLMHALRLLAEGAKVTHVALEAGYSTPSAFISMFKKTLGTTPLLYFKQLGEGSRAG